MTRTHIPNIARNGIPPSVDAERERLRGLTFVPVGSTPLPPDVRLKAEGWIELTRDGKRKWLDPIYRGSRRLTDLKAEGWKVKS